jgi:hypothetical protein
MFNAWGYGVYFFFASMTLISIAFVYFLIPETKSIPLEAIDRLFEIKPVRHANRILMAELATHDIGGNMHVADVDGDEKTDLSQIEHTKRSSGSDQV